MDTARKGGGAGSGFVANIKSHVSKIAGELLYITGAQPGSNNASHRGSEIRGVGGSHQAGGLCMACVMHPVIAGNLCYKQYL